MNSIRSFIARQSGEEIARQHALLDDGQGTRSILTGLVYLISTLFTPIWVVVPCAIIDFRCEYLGVRWMRGLIPAQHPRRYIGTLMAVIGSELAYCINIAWAFQSDRTLAQAFAAAVISLTMLQLGSIRAVHLPYALAGLSTALLVASGAVLVFWLAHWNASGFLLSQFALIATAYFVFALVRSNHRLHHDMARERAASRSADEAKTRFLAQMSHELRTPLNAILGLSIAEWASAHSKTSTDRLELITDSARRLAVMLDDILDMSAIQAGQLPIRPLPANIRHELRAAVALYQPSFEGRGLTTALTLDPSLPERAVFDAQRLRQCMSNLLSNAVKHTVMGGVTVQAAMQDGALLRVDVVDTGPGVPEPVAAHIFEPFNRGPGAQSGNGLGLSISRALARGMGGDVALKPSDTGAHFVLTIRLSPAPDEIAQTAKPTRPELPAAANPVRVLVVDDIATNRLVALTLLNLLGVSGDEAASGEEAVRMIRDDPPDLVFLDMNMPGLDGVETLMQIRRLPSRSARLPVIAMTADTTEEHQRSYVAAGLDGFIAKPLSPEAMIVVLTRHLGFQGKQVQRAESGA